MTDEEGDLLLDSAEELFEDAPCGYLSTALDGTIIKVNRTFETWTGLRREDLLGRRRFQDLLGPGGRIYHETHYAPMLRLQGAVREIAVEIVRADGSRLPALVNSVMRTDAEGRPRVVRTTVFDATERRRYEDELVRARRYEQDIAQRLQRSLLAGELPEVPGVEVGIAYRPAVRGLEVGGDWYDAFPVDGGRSVAIVVGDVVGRGIDAAAAMGQLRSAVRALAGTGLGPGALLDALDAYARRHAVGRMTTLIYAQIAAATGELRYACAGHPPLAVAPAEGAPFLAWDGRSPPLDAHLGAPLPRSEGRVALDRGASVVLYTDGLVERRRRALNEGFDGLLEQLREASSTGPRKLSRDVLDALHDDDGDADDTCVLAARYAGG